MRYYSVHDAQQCWFAAMFWCGCWVGILTSVLFGFFLILLVEETVTVRVHDISLTPTPVRSGSVYFAGVFMLPSLSKVGHSNQIQMYLIDFLFWFLIQRCNRFVQEVGVTWIPTNQPSVPVDEAYISRRPSFLRPKAPYRQGFSYRPVLSSWIPRVLFRKCCSSIISEPAGESRRKTVQFEQLPQLEEFYED